MTNVLRNLIGAAAVMGITLSPASLWAAEPGADHSSGFSAALKYPDPKLNAFLKRVLSSMNLKYTVDPGPDGEWIRWMSRSAAEEQEIRRRVSQYAFAIANCKPEQTPSPAMASRAGVTC